MDDRPHPSELTDAEIQEALDNIKGWFDQEHIRLSNSKVSDLEADRRALLEEQYRRDNGNTDD